MKKVISWSSIVLFVLMLIACSINILSITAMAADDENEESGIKSFMCKPESVTAYGTYTNYYEWSKSEKKSIASGAKYSNKNFNKNNYVVCSKAIYEDGKYYDLVIYPFTDGASVANVAWYGAITDGYVWFYEHGSHMGATFFVTETGDLDAKVEWTGFIGGIDLDNGEYWAYPSDYKVSHQGDRVDSEQYDLHETHTKYVGTKEANNQNMEHRFIRNAIMGLATIPKTGMTVYYGNIDQRGSAIAFDQTALEDMAYTIQFNANGGDPASVPAYMIQFGKTHNTVMGKLESVVPTREGYLFRGWSAIESPLQNKNTCIAASYADAGGEEYCKQSEETWTFKDYCDNTGGDYSNNNTVLTLYAQWEENTGYVVCEDRIESENGELLGTQEQKTYIVSKIAKGSDWGYDKTNNAYYNKYHYVGCSQIEVSELHKTYKVYRYFEKNEYEVECIDTCEETGYREKLDNKTYKVDETAKGSDWGKTLKGYTYDSCTELTVAEGQEERLVYRYWKPIEYTITYNANKPDNASKEIEGKTEDSKHKYDIEKNLTKNAYTLEGWKFKEWKDQYNIKYEDEQAVKNLTAINNQIIKFDAQWEPNTYIVNIYSNKPDNISGVVQKLKSPDGWTWEADHWTKQFIYDKTKLDCAPSELFSISGCDLDKDNYYINKECTGNTYKVGDTNLTSKDKDTVNLYVKWTSVTYYIEYNSLDTDVYDWNEVDVYTQQLKNDGLPFTLDENKFKREANSTYDAYKFIGWSETKGSWTKKYDNKQTLTKGLTTKDNDVIKLYAIWEKPLTLTLDLNGGYYNDESVVEVSAKIYNTQYYYDFNIVGGNVAEKENYYTKQNGIINIYGDYDDNGLNSRLIKVDDKNTEYRLLGWSTNPDATEPDSELIVYDTEHKSTYRIYNNTTLYAVWEPVLSVNLSLKRTLGDMTLNGMHVVGDAKGIKAVDGTQIVSVIAKPGEQCYYSITTNSNKEHFIGIRFDYSILDIYAHDGIWKDNLNPRRADSDEELLEYCGLDRNINTTESHLARKFYIPQYLGTQQSYVSSVGKTEYRVEFVVIQDSYYYKHFVDGVDKEQVQVVGIIYIPLKGSSEVTVLREDETIISILDELSTKLKVKLKNE